MHLAYQVIDRIDRHRQRNKLLVECIVYLCSMYVKNDASYIPVVCICLLLRSTHACTY